MPDTDFEALDNPQDPNHPMVTPHRADLPAENDDYAEGQRIHDEEIADKKVEQGYGDRDGEVTEVNGPDDRTETGTPSDGAGANEGKTIKGGEAPR